MHFIQSGIVSNKAGKLYTRLFELRQTGDYDDMYNLAEEDVKPLITPAHDYMNELSAIIRKS